MLSPPYSKLYQCLAQVIPATRLIYDDLRTLAYGTDASFYRLVPKLVVRVESEEEVVAVLRHSRDLKTPLTFRAGGTSLSGQSLSDSVLVQLGTSWRGLQIHSEGFEISLQPGVIGSHANLRLQPYLRKIGPDPASINSAMIGGIAANNASGMCCGTSQNTYNTVSGMRVIFADGAVLDTRRPESRQEFSRTHAQLLARLTALAQRTKKDHGLATRIRRKFKMKNTTGYSLNALVDFDDPFEIIQHLMVGSEGTLGFIAEITYRTVPDLPFKATSLMLFPDIKTACEATIRLRRCRVAAVEIMDRASLHSVENKVGMPTYLKQLVAAASALLVETRAESRETLREQILETIESLQSLPIVQPLSFTMDKTEYTRLWNIRKGLFPSIGAIREIGTTVIIEDVAFPIDQLAAATLELQVLFRQHGYSEAIIFGHALEGNLHFVFTQDFNSQTEVRRYQAFIDDLTRMVVHTYDGSLKAEHGTGRNMAPFVELEWGREAYQLMQEIKDIFDPQHLLNPGVILNSDPLTHVKNLKPLPQAHPVVDRCIECGFCEVNCPSRDLTLTPRQRIAVWREISRLSATRENPAKLANLKKGFAYQGEQTCATDGLCAISCPVSIDTGRLMKEIRAGQNSGLAALTAALVARNLALTTSAVRSLLTVADLAHRVLGSTVMDRAAALARSLSGNRLPRWNCQLPRAADSIAARGPDESSVLKAVYFPSCISRTFGVARGSPESISQPSKIDALLRKGGFDVIYPPGLSGLCCGMPFASKGFKKQGDWKLEELENVLWEASSRGRYPVLFDTSPCLYRFKESSQEGQNLESLELAEFILKFLSPRLRFRKSPFTVAVHSPCSSLKLGSDSKLRELAQLCAETVVVPDNVGCCGFAGDRGFSYPELTTSALHSIRDSLPRECRAGYSTSRTCEIGLSLHSGMPYRSIAYLVDECTETL